MRRRALTMAGVMFLGLMAGVGIFAFRVETLDNPDLGILTFYHRWNHRSKLYLDTDRDGDPESISVLSGAPPFRTWEDLNNDGDFELAFDWDGEAVSFLSFDADSDGIPEIELFGEEANRLWRLSTEGSSDPIDRRRFLVRRQQDV